MHMLDVSLLYRQSIKIAPSKAVVGVDRPMKALSMPKPKPYKGNCLCSHSHLREKLSKFT